MTEMRAQAQEIVRKHGIWNPLYSDENAGVLTTEAKAIECVLEGIRRGVEAGLEKVNAAIAPVLTKRGKALHGHDEDGWWDIREELVNAIRALGRREGE